MCKDNHSFYEITESFYLKNKKGVGRLPSPVYMGLANKKPLRDSSIPPHPHTHFHKTNDALVYTIHNIRSYMYTEAGVLDELFS